MAGALSMEAVGNWNKEMGTSLKDALRVSMEIMGRTGEQATKHALILMAQSASAMTRKAKKNRKVERDEHGKFVTVHPWLSRPMELYEWRFSEDNPYRVPGTWENAKRIGYAGMAKRSWLWGLGKLGKTRIAREYRKGYKVHGFAGSSVAGYVYGNFLNYILKAMPPGWSTAVAAKATNKMMAQARNKMQNKWKAAMRRKTRARQKMGDVALQSFFKAL